MTRELTRVAVIITAGVILASAAPAAAVTINTKRIHTVPGGKVVCTAANKSHRPIGITAEIIATDGRNVTDFIQTPWENEAEQVLSAVISESRDPAASYCRVTVTGGRRSDVNVLLEVFDAEGRRVSFTGR
jgi:hypothetical protein